MEEKETKENKVKKWLKKNEADIVGFVIAILCVLVFVDTWSICSRQNDRMAILQEMYHENSEDIVIKANVITEGCMKWEFMRDTYKYIDHKAINAYLERNDLIEYSDLSDERFDLEVDAFVYIFKSELILDDSLKELIMKREFIEKEMRETEEN